MLSEISFCLNILNRYPISRWDNYSRVCLKKKVNLWSIIIYQNKLYHKFVKMCSMVVKIAFDSPIKSNDFIRKWKMGKILKIVLSKCHFTLWACLLMFLSQQRFNNSFTFPHFSFGSYHPLPHTVNSNLDENTPREPLPTWRSLIHQFFYGTNKKKFLCKFLWFLF